MVPCEDRDRLQLWLSNSALGEQNEESWVSRGQTETEDPAKLAVSTSLVDTPTLDSCDTEL